LSLEVALTRAVGPLLVAAAIAVLLLPLSPAYDLDVFLRAGHAVVHALQVYPRPGSPAVYSGSSFVYPFAAVLPFVAPSVLPLGVSTALFFVVSIGAMLAACVVAAEGDTLPATLVLCCSFAITGLQLGALSPLLFAGAVFLWRLRHRPVAFAVLAAAVVASKLFLAPLLVWLLLARRWRAFAYATGLTLAVLAAGFVFGPIGPVPYVRLLSQLGAHEARAGFGLIGALLNAGLSQVAAQAAAILLAVSLFAAAHLHYRRWQDERVLFGAGIVASLVLTPVLWSHYLLVVASVLLVFGARREWFVLLALASWAIAPPHGVQLDTDLIHGLNSSGTWMAVAVFLLLKFASSTRPVRVRLERLSTAHAKRRELHRDDRPAVALAIRPGALN
jgi:alpha-1,2-mannosyltransferase